MSEYSCPIDWCEFEGELGSVRGHVNGSTDPEHDWSELKEQVEAQNDQQEGPPSEGDEPEDGAVLAGSDDDQPEEGVETSDEGGQEAPSEGGKMPTEEEYQQQTQNDQGEPTDSDENETSKEEGQEAPSEGGSDPSTGAGAAAAGGATALIAGQSVWVVVGVAALALLVVLLLTSDQGEAGDGNVTGTSAEGGNEAPSEGGSSDGDAGLVTNE